MPARSWKRKLWLATALTLAGALAVLPASDGEAKPKPAKKKGATKSQPAPQPMPTSKKLPAPKQTPTTKKTPTPKKKPATKKTHNAPNAPNAPRRTSPVPRRDAPPLELEIDNWGFEYGLKGGWVATGNAFSRQPIVGDAVKASRVIGNNTVYKMPLGGDYWQKLTFPIGHKGRKWIGTFERVGDAGRGTLSSKPFAVDSNYITFLVSGGSNENHLKVELLQKPKKSNRKQAKKKGHTPPPTYRYVDGDYVPVSGTVRTGHNHELMRREWWDVRKLRGKTVRIRITDTATGGWGHINVDDFRFQAKAPHQNRVDIGNKTFVKQAKVHTFATRGKNRIGFVDWDSPVWGVADMHTHPAAHLGFGKKLMHGSPDGKIQETFDNCNCTHGGWGIDNGCGNHIRAIVVGMTDKIYVHRAGAEQLMDHPHAGLPKLEHWPHFTSVTHQQMRVEWIKRAHEGGLRVLVGLAVNNHLLAEVIDGDNPKDDKRSADAQIDFMSRFVARHKFMEVAKNPAQLRDIVRRGKLAVILGIEVDNIGNMNYGGGRPSDRKIKAEIQRLHRKGVRYIFPVHVTDNPFGGAAIYEAMFNYANRFNAVQPMPASLGAMVPGTSFVVETAPDKRVRARLAPVLPNSVALGARGLLDLLEHAPMPPFGQPLGLMLAGEREYQVLKAFFLTPDPATTAYHTTRGGHRNAKGLSRRGEVALKEMMRLGMIIDIDHMSEKTVEATLSLAEKVKGGYPLVSGHNTFRAMKFEANENQRTEKQARRLVELGGTMGIGWGFEHDEGKDASFKNAIKRVGGRGWTHSKVADSCGGTSRRFAQNFLYALEQMRGAHVALGSDINGMVPPPGPRFGRLRNLDGSRCRTQQNPVLYRGGRPATTAGAQRIPLSQARMGRHKWNVNHEGVAHYGLLPDFLQDLKNVGLDPRDMSKLFRSAEHLARTWDRALRNSR